MNPVEKRPPEDLISEPINKRSKFDFPVINLNEKFSKELESLTFSLKGSITQQETYQFLKTHKGKVKKISLNDPEVYPIEWIQNNISHLNSLKVLHLEKILLTQGLLSAIQTNSTISEFKIAVECCFYRDRVKELTEMLCSDFPLISLKVNCDGCPPENARTVFENLCGNEQMKELSLKIKDIFVYDEYPEIYYDSLGEPLAKLIAGNRCLEKIRLTHLKITDEEAALIAQSLKTNSILKRLDLSGCAMTDNARKMVERGSSYAGRGQEAS